MIELKKEDGYFPIMWFGDRGAYKDSKIKIITVALNPSETEFCDNDKKHDNAFRFPKWEESLEDAYNDYFNQKPYKWFNNFEHILRRFGASYGGNKLVIKNDEKCGEDYPYRAIHTDLCTPYATQPAWAQPVAEKEQQSNEEDKEKITKRGIPEWQSLVEELQPDVIIFSVARKYWSQLNNLIGIEQWKSLKNDFGKARNCWYYKGYYQLRDKKALAILGITTQRGPFGDLKNEEMMKLGDMIKKEL